MKTIEEAAHKYAIDKIDELCIEYDCEKNKEIDIAVSTKDFKAGVEFTQRWIPVEEELPITLESGNWDGLRSEFVIVKFKDGNWTKARLYAGFIDGNKFNDWYDERDYGINANYITHWRPIELK